MTSETNMVRIPKLPDPSIARIPKCARCRNHGIDCELKGHKEKCKFKNCACRSCLVVVERQKVTATRVAHLRHQRKLAVKRGTETQDFRNRNPLTEEEELILSRHLQNKSAEEKEYGSRGAAYPHNKGIERQIERHERYSEVIPPFANTKACMLLREAQNAYSYFYGKPYYPDEKDERSSESSHPGSVKHHHEDKYYRDRDSHSVSYSKTFKTVCSRDGHHDSSMHAKCTDRAIIAPRVMRLDENQYYSEYFKSTSTRGDYYYEQKLSVHNPPPPLYKYERSSSSSSSSSSSCHNVSIAHSHRLIEPLKVNNGMDKEVSGTHACEQVVPSTHHNHNHNHNHNHINNNNNHNNNNNNNNHSHNLDKRLEVLVVMFPEMKESRLKEVLRQHNSDIQSTVQYLLKLKNSPMDGAPPPCPRSGSAGSGSGGMNYPSYGSNTVKRSDSFSDISRSPHATYSVDEKVVPKSESCTPDGSEVSAFTAVRRKCAR